MKAETDLGRVQRVDGPTPHIVALSVYRRDPTADAGLREVLVLDARRGIRRVRERPRGQDADGFVRRLRKLLVGARVHAEARDEGPGVRLVLRRGDLDAVLLAEGGMPVLRERSSGKPLAGRQRLATRAPAAEPWTPFVPPLDEAPTPASTAPAGELLRALRSARKRLVRKERAIAADAARAEEAPALRHEAELITAHMSRYVAGAETLEVLDWGASPPAPRTLIIDASRGAKKHAERLFKRARRYARGAEIAASRRADTQAELRDLDALLERLDRAFEPEERQVIEAHASARGWCPATPGHGARRGGSRESSRRSYRAFRASDGGLVLVGRSAAGNDELTLRVARPHDLWLHARSVRGAHVVVPLGRGEICPPERLIDAATLAAHFSEAAGESTVEVQHTPRRHVHKRKGHPPGAVHVSREKVLVLRREKERARARIARELRA